MPTATQFAWSPMQEAVYTFVESGQGSAVIEANAGSAKTTTLVEAAMRLDDWTSAACIAFNVRIKDELVKRLPPNVPALTLNALGYRSWKAHIGKSVEVDKFKIATLVREMSDDSNADYRAGVKRLVDLAKMAGIVPAYVKMETCPLVEDTPETWTGLIEEYGVSFGWGDKADRAIELARRVLAESVRVGAERIDFNDQLYLPVIFGADFPSYDLLFVDECFVGDTPILLDTCGKSASIESLFNKNYSGSVVSWGPKGIVSKKVLAVRRILATKPMLRLEIQRLAFNKKGERLQRKTAQVLYGKRFLICTEDHRIWSGGHWVKAKDLLPGALVMCESVAPRDKAYNNRYKHSERGRRSLVKNGDTKRFGERFRGGAIHRTNRGGNGKGPTICEQVLLERLGGAWEMQFVVPTKKGRKSGYPTCYKIDLADPIRQIAIEVDGHSHNYRRDQDEKKDTFLRQLGWEVIRIKNEEVLSLSDEILHAKVFNSPCEAMIMSVEPWVNRKEHFVYDLTVKDTHCYFAHGTLVHNCQDLNDIQRVMVERSLGAKGRLIAVGDPNQAIYQFRGAGKDAMPRLQVKFNAISLPLSICYRCSRAVIKEAQKWVPGIQAWEGAVEGKVEELEGWTPQTFRPTDVILCRNNAPLVKMAFRLIRAGTPAKMLGRDIGNGLTALVKKFKVESLEELRGKLGAYVAKEADKLNPDQLSSLQDKVATVQIFLENARTPADAIAKIELMFSDETGQFLLLSSVHRFKGLEAPRVFILDRHLIGAREPENNIFYVACTRAKTDLFYIQS